MHTACKLTLARRNFKWAIIQPPVPPPTTPPPPPPLGAETRVEAQLTAVLLHDKSTWKSYCEQPTPCHEDDSVKLIIDSVSVKCNEKREEAVKTNSEPKRRGRPPKSLNKPHPLCVNGNSVKKLGPRKSRHSRRSFRHDSIQTFKPSAVSPPWRFKNLAHRVMEPRPAAPRPTSSLDDALVIAGDDLDTVAFETPTRKSSTCSFNSEEVAVRRQSLVSAGETSDSSHHSHDSVRDDEEVARRRRKREAVQLLKEVNEQLNCSMMQEKRQRISQDLPGFNWLEEKYSGSAGRPSSPPPPPPPSKPSTSPTRTSASPQHKPGSIFPHRPRTTSPHKPTATSPHKPQATPPQKPPPPPVQHKLAAPPPAKILEIARLPSVESIATPPSEQRRDVYMIGVMHENDAAVAEAIRRREDARTQGVDAQRQNGNRTSPAAWGFSSHVNTMARHVATSFDTGEGATRPFRPQPPIIGATGIRAVRPGPPSYESTSSRVQFQAPMPLYSPTGRVPVETAAQHAIRHAPPNTSVNPVIEIERVNTAQGVMARPAVPSATAAATAGLVFPQSQGYQPLDEFHSLTHCYQPADHPYDAQIRERHVPSHMVNPRQNQTQNLAQLYKSPTNNSPTQIRAPQMRVDSGDRHCPQESMLQSQAARMRESPLQSQRIQAHDRQLQGQHLQMQDLQYRECANHKPATALQTQIPQLQISPLQNVSINSVQNQHLQIRDNPLQISSAPNDISRSQRAHLREGPIHNQQHQSPGTSSKLHNPQNQDNLSHYQSNLMSNETLHSNQRPLQLRPGRPSQASKNAYQNQQAQIRESQTRNSPVQIQMRGNQLQSQHPQIREIPLQSQNPSGQELPMQHLRSQLENSLQPHFAQLQANHQFQHPQARHPQSQHPQSQHPQSRHPQSQQPQSQRPLTQDPQMLHNAQQLMMNQMSIDSQRPFNLPNHPLQVANNMPGNNTQFRAGQMQVPTLPPNNHRSYPDNPNLQSYRSTTQPTSSPQPEHTFVPPYSRVPQQQNAPQQNAPQQLSDKHYYVPEAVRQARYEMMRQNRPQDSRVSAEVPWRQMCSGGEQRITQQVNPVWSQYPLQGINLMETQMRERIMADRMMLEENAARLAARQAMQNEEKQRQLYELKRQEQQNRDEQDKRDAKYREEQLKMEEWVKRQQEHMKFQQEQRKEQQLQQRMRLQQESLAAERQNSVPELIPIPRPANSVPTVQPEVTVEVVKQPLQPLPSPLLKSPVLSHHLKSPMPSLSPNTPPNMLPFKTNQNSGTKSSPSPNHRIPPSPPVNSYKNTFTEEHIKKTLTKHPVPLARTSPAYKQPSGKCADEPMDLSLPKKDAKVTSVVQVERQAPVVASVRVNVEEQPQAIVISDEEETDRCIAVRVDYVERKRNSPTKETESSPPVTEKTGHAELTGREPAEVEIPVYAEPESVTVTSCDEEDQVPSLDRVEMDSAEDILYITDIEEALSPDERDRMQVLTHYIDGVIQEQEDRLKNMPVSIPHKDQGDSTESVSDTNIVTDQYQPGKEGERNKTAGTGVIISPREPNSDDTTTQTTVDTTSTDSYYTIEILDPILQNRFPRVEAPAPPTARHNLPVQTVPGQTESRRVKYVPVIEHGRSHLLKQSTSIDAASTSSDSPSTSGQGCGLSQLKGKLCLCGKVAQFTCSNCKSALYCGPACQRNAWSEHGKECQQKKEPKPL